MLAGDNTRPARPLLVRATVCGLPGRLSLMFRLAAKLPVALGEKVTLMLQPPPAGSEPGQLLVWEKVLLFAPVIAIDEMLTALRDVFVTVTVIGLLVVPAFWIGKLRLDGETTMPRTACGKAAEVLEVKTELPL